MYTGSFVTSDALFMIIRCHYGETISHVLVNDAYEATPWYKKVKGKTTDIVDHYRYFGSYITTPQEYILANIGVKFEASSQTGWYEIPVVYADPITVQAVMIGKEYLHLYDMQSYPRDKRPDKIDVIFLKGKSPYCSGDMYVNQNKTSGQATVPTGAAYASLVGSNSTALVKSSILSAVDIVADATIAKDHRSGLEKYFMSDYEPIAIFKEVTFQRPDMSTISADDSLVNVTIKIFYNDYILYEL